MTTVPAPPQYAQLCSIILYTSTLPVPSHLLQPVAMLPSAYKSALITSAGKHLQRQYTAPGGDQEQYCV